MSSSTRYRTYVCLNEPSTDYIPSIVVTVLLSVVITLNIIEIIFSSTSDFAQFMGDWTVYASYSFAVFFTIEYLFRLWSAPEAPLDKAGEWRKRWNYVKSPMGLIDLFSCLPILIWAFLPADQLGDIRFLKLISMVRVFKLTRYSSSLSMLFRVFLENKHTLLAAALVIIILMVVSSAGIYMFERHLQPEHFGSIPGSMWWAVVTLTTVGYGDVTPITLGGKIFGALVMICGVGIAAMPAGIFASSFVSLISEQQKERQKKARFKKSVLSQNVGESGYPPVNVRITKSEQHEADFLVEEYGLSFEQAVSIVRHFRHHS